MVQVVAELQELWTEHREEIDASVCLIEDAVGALAIGGMNDAGRHSARRAAHQLAGTVGTFGFADASEHARALEQALEHDPAHEDAPRLAALVASLHVGLEDDVDQDIRSDRTDAPRVLGARPPPEPLAIDPGTAALAPRDAQPVTVTVDVVVVEDDVVLSDLLEHSLRARGYSCHAIADGDEAMDALTGARPPVSASVVLLDWDLPGRTGLGVLRGLGQAGVLTETHVLMLTLRPSEDEAHEALELGAFDHLAKPFSIPVLMERVRRALER